MRKILFYSLIINVLVLALCFLFGGARYGALDDYFMAKILEGAYSDGYNVHMVFVNVAYGYVLLPLYHLFPKISWYYIGELFSVFLSLSVVSYIAIRKVGLQWGPIFVVVLVSCIAPDYYLSLQFTQCASLLSAAGMLTLLYAVENHFEKELPKTILKPITFAVGFVLLFWGSVMRWDAFFMGLPFLALSLVLNFDVCWRNKIKVILCFAIALAGTMGLKYLNNNHYSSPEYHAFMKFQPYRVAVGDGNNYDMNAAYDDLDEIDITSEKLLNLRDWFLYDKDVFSLEKMAPIVRVINENKTHEDFRDIVTFSLYDIAALIQKPIGIPWVIVCLLLFWRNKERSWYTWGSFILLLVLIGYLMFISRNVYRVENGLILYAAILGINFLKPVSFSSKKNALISLIVIALVCGSATSVSAKYVRDPSTGKIKDSTTPSKQIDYQGISNYIESAPDSVLFMVSMQPFMSIGKNWYSPYKAASFGCWGKFISFGYWTPYFPDIEKILKEKGVVNPVKDVVHDNVFVIGDDITTFLRENHYNSQTIKKSVIQSFGDLTIDKYSIVKDLPNE